MAFLKNIELRFRQWFVRRLLQRSHTTQVQTKLVEHAEDYLQLQPHCKILVLRQDRIGDVIVSMPVVRALRKQYPQARIDMLLSDNNFTVRNLVLVYADSVWRYTKKLPALVRLVRELRRVRYDVVVDLIDNASVTSSLLITIAAPRYAVGIWKENFYAYTHCVALLDQTRFHIVHRIAQLLLPFGLDPVNTNLDAEYPISNEEAADARKKLGLEAQDFEPRSDHSVTTTFSAVRLGINLSGRGDEMYWGRENFTALIRALQARYGAALEILLFAMPDYAAELHAVAEAVNDQTPTLRIAPPASSLHEFAAMLHECDAVFTPDTSVVHLAAAWKRPTVALYLYNEFGLVPWTPFNTPHRALVVEKQAFERGENNVRSIPLEMGLAAVQSLLEEQFSVLVYH